MQAELIYNPFAGQADVRREIQEAVDFLARSGWQITRHETSRANSASIIAKQAVQRGADVVIAAGGDGTINETINGLIGSETALGVLPIGTTNVWALQTGIPSLKPVSVPVARIVTDLEHRLANPLPVTSYRKVIMDAARVLVKGRVIKVDAGEAAGRYFLMWAGAGIDASIIQSVSAKSKRTLGSWAYVLPTLDTVRLYPTTNLRLRMDGREITTSSPFVVVSNIQLYGGMLAIGARACANDGKLDVCIFKGEGFFTFVQYALEILSRKHIDDPGTEYYQCREITIESGRRLPVQLDGEAVTETPVNIRIVPEALKVIVPQKLTGNLFKINRH